LSYVLCLLSLVDGENIGDRRKYYRWSMNYYSSSSLKFGCFRRLCGLLRVVVIGIRCGVSFHVVPGVPEGRSEHCEDNVEKCTNTRVSPCGCKPLGVPMPNSLRMLTPRSRQSSCSIEIVYTIPPVLAAWRSAKLLLTGSLSGSSRANPLMVSSPFYSGQT